jgi:hypothetical protein
MFLIQIIFNIYLYSVIMQIENLKVNLYIHILMKDDKK